MAANVNYVRDELNDVLDQYDLIADCLAGEKQVKKKRSLYLPIPDEGSATDNTKRYNSYIKRAVFYNATARTLNGFIGEIFSREPNMKLPKKLEVVGKDASGNGVSLIQQSKKAASHVIAYGRAGLFVDFPTRDKPASLAEIENGTARPTITLYEPRQIINWRTTVRGARRILSLVVLEEKVIAEDDGFEAKEITRWRELRLINGEYYVTLWEKSSAKAGGIVKKGTVKPLDAKGNSFDEIPFTFIGSENNDDVIDDAPLYDIASLNIAHYRNSADYEESCFISGQPTPVFSGLTEEWVKNVLGNRIVLGARAAVSLPVGGSAQLLQAGQNTLPFEAMGQKEKQMAALGARIAEAKTTVRTATEASIDYTTENSILASAANNVSTAIVMSLNIAAKFIGESTEEIVFKLNTDFDIAKMSSEDRRQLLEEWQSGGISWPEYRDAMRKSGLATMDDEKAKELIDKEQAEMAALANMDSGNDNQAGQRKPT